MEQLQSEKRENIFYCACGQIADTICSTLKCKQSAIISKSNCSCPKQKHSQCTKFINLNELINQLSGKQKHLSKSQQEKLIEIQKFYNDLIEQLSVQRQNIISLIKNVNRQEKQRTFYESLKSNSIERFTGKEIAELMTEFKNTQKLTSQIIQTNENQLITKFVSYGQRMIASAKQLQKFNERLLILQQSIIQIANQNKQQWEKVLEQIQKGTRLRQIKVLDFQYKKMFDLQLQVVALHSQVWINLEEISLKRNQITEEGIKAFAKKEWKKLKRLYLQRNSIKNQGLKHLCNQKWEELVLLDLQKTDIDGQGMKQFKKQSWDKISWLDLSFNNIGDKGMAILVQIPWKSLNVFWMQMINLTPVGVDLLISRSWQSLQRLPIAGNPFGQKEMQKLKKKFKHVFEKFAD